MIRRLTIIASMLFLSCNNHKGAAITKEVEKIKPTSDQAERRRQSEAYCKAHHIPVYGNPNALFVDPESQAAIRTKDEVTNRATALLYVGLKSEGIGQKDLDEINKNLDALSKLTAAERVYVTNPQPTKQQTTDANWRYEDLHVMLWALGFIDSLAYPDQLCNVAQDAKIFRGLTDTQFKQRARLRTKKEILDQADLILRLDWACVDARTKKQPAPGMLDSGVVYERHYALNWLINYMSQGWDDITTDT
ncbi:DUF4272 domain-containing protein [Mucilaginibacter ginsenosidivorax]|uniref:DUF4272 domain-containing protein n=1 Tax=Mucilaginibacter ginsenosidivorax TaxID=862126 RepID=A0A5B8W215_9SPHI|nr:DUF4272 domain-containing protein [Mucilaginibacter ginsenosidivorax]QEC77005.1 DUF4272 domain-containing protein [Mucilaginibacter ginsenosidivorax]